MWRLTLKSDRLLALSNPDASLATLYQTVLIPPSIIITHQGVTQWFQLDMEDYLS